MPIITETTASQPITGDRAAVEAEAEAAVGAGMGVRAVSADMAPVLSAVVLVAASPSPAVARGRVRHEIDVNVGTQGDVGSSPVERPRFTARTFSFNPRRPTVTPCV
jgi:hypothetical protein